MAYTVIINVCFNKRIISANSNSNKKQRISKKPNGILQEQIYNGLPYCQQALFCRERTLCPRQYMSISKC